MAITSTRSVQRIETYPAQSSGEEAAVMVVYVYTFDDSEDDELPLRNEKVKHIRRYQEQAPSEESQAPVATDYSAEDALVRSICDAIWS